MNAGVLFVFDGHLHSLDLLSNLDSTVRLADAQEFAAQQQLTCACVGVSDPFHRASDMPTTAPLSYYSLLYI